MGSSAPAVTVPDHPKPQKPEEPDPLDCCGSGCDRCVFDIYDEAIEGYRQELADWEKTQDDGSESGNA